MKKYVIILVWALLPVAAMAQGSEDREHREAVIKEARYLKSVLKIDEAVDTLSTLVNSSFDEEVMAELADCHFQNGDYENAAGTYMMLSSTRPTNLLYKVRQTAVFYRLKAYQQAVEAGKATLQIDSVPAIMSLVGDAYNQLEQPDSAIVYYNHALAKRPGNASTVNKLAKLYLDRKAYDQAVATSDAYLALVPDDFTIAPIKGLALYLKGDAKSAAEVFEKQLELGNESYGVHFHLGQSYWQMKKVHDAGRELLAAWQIDSSDVNLAFSIAGVRGDSFLPFETDVKPWLDKVLAMLEPDHAMMSRVNQQYGFNYYKMNVWDKAIEYYKEAYRYNPSFISALSTVAYCYEQKKDYKSAKEWYEKYVKVAKPGTKAYEFAKESLDYVMAELFMEEK